MALSSFVSLWKAAAVAVAELNVASFFIAGALAGEVGTLAPWFVLIGWAMSVLVRAIDIESWAFSSPAERRGARKRRSDKKQRDWPPRQRSPSASCWGRSVPC